VSAIASFIHLSYLYYYLLRYFPILVIVCYVCLYYGERGLIKGGWPKHSQRGLDRNSMVILHDIQLKEYNTGTVWVLSSVAFVWFVWLLYLC